MAEGLKAAFGGEPAAQRSSVHRVLQKKTGSQLDLHLHDKDEESDVPVKIDDEAKALRDPSGRYQVLGEIGRGGVGVVYKGRDQDLGRDVAIKVLRAEHVSRPEILERFVEEAQIGGQLQHPGIVPVYELGLQSGDRPYFAMKLVKGETLAELLARAQEPGRRPPPLPRHLRAGLPDDRLRARAARRPPRPQAAQRDDRRVRRGAGRRLGFREGAAGERRGCADASKAAVAASVISTVRCRPEEGLALRRRLDDGHAGLHAAGAGARRRRAHRPRSDVFGLGAILCEILTGQPPYLAADDDLVHQAARADLSRCLRAAGAMRRRRGAHRVVQTMPVAFTAGATRFGEAGRGGGRALPDLGRGAGAAGADPRRRSEGEGAFDVAVVGGGGAGAGARRRRLSLCTTRSADAPGSGEPARRRGAERRERPPRRGAHEAAAGPGVVGARRGRGRAGGAARRRGRRRWRRA